MSYEENIQSLQNDVQVEQVERQRQKNCNLGKCETVYFSWEPVICEVTRD